MNVSNETDRSTHRTISDISPPGLIGKIASYLPFNKLVLFTSSSENVIRTSSLSNFFREVSIIDLDSLRSNQNFNVHLDDLHIFQSHLSDFCRRLKVRISSSAKMDKAPNKIISYDFVVEDFYSFDKSLLNIVDSLKNLDLHSNAVKEVDRLSELVALNYLTLSFNEISSIQNLSNLIQLNHLDLKGNLIQPDNLDLEANQISWIQNILKL
ncbi:uncharacterized protein ASCRUDRAFT_8067 [Ascoidea rubescens DSM 1968]|uniref:L domain-like protein n=1 Tax=Ascoidea rubescens DSM 1968 TaxID=1344418 RepID=A0A1D2VHP0_9ASCO|nr:hypothetical protein ASCRUDRAFT_8067 [Ascoidea rubescens DSM 1968]ODV61112.1 hypothetical protein ASCRUDRAFT_8067 [Ascoidea rubescens DSM 1968]